MQLVPHLKASNSLYNAKVPTHSDSNELRPWGTRLRLKLGPGIQTLNVNNHYGVRITTFYFYHEMKVFATHSQSLVVLGLVAHVPHDRLLFRTLVSVGPSALDESSELRSGAKCLFSRRVYIGSRSARIHQTRCRDDRRGDQDYHPVNHFTGICTKKTKSCHSTPVRYKAKLLVPLSIQVQQSPGRLFVDLLVTATPH